MLLAAELALVAIDPDSGRAAIGGRSTLNACLAGVLVGDPPLSGAAASTLATASTTPSKRARWETSARVSALLAEAGTVAAVAATTAAVGTTAG